MKYIGIPCKLFDGEYFGIRKYYHTFFSKYGTVLPLPLTSPEAYNEILKIVKLLVLPGGADINPNMYGRIPELETQQSDSILEYYDITLLPMAINAKIPVMGICRGFQSLITYFNGALIQDLEGHPYSETWDQLVHPITRISADGTKSQAQVNSLHHQGQLIDDLPDELEAIAFAKDGVCEAFVGREARVLGVQWHPEVLPSDPWLEKYILKLIAN